MADWSELDRDLLFAIVRKIELYQDLVAFGGVCTSWWSVAIMEKLRFKYNQAPWLMLPPQKGVNQRGFFSLSKRTTRLVSLPQAIAKKCFPSKGWLITSAQDYTMSLLHPFTRVEIKLPHMKTFQNWRDDITDGLKHLFFIRKCVLSSSPSSTADYAVMVIHSSNGKLAYCKRGDRTWTTVQTSFGMFYDVIYYKDKFYAFHTTGKIFACDVSSNANNKNPTEAHLVAQIPNRIWGGKHYLVESGSVNTLLYVRRAPLDYSNLNDSNKFIVFNVDLSTNTWTQVNNIGDRTIFLGFNSSFSIKTDHHSTCKPNCIYFTDDNAESYWIKRRGRAAGMDSGIYNIEDGNFIPHSWDSLCNRLNPPVWVENCVD